MIYLAIPLLVIAILWLYIRLAPSDPARWHVDPDKAVAPPKGSYRTELTVPLPPEDALQAFATAALDTPRTRTLARGVGEGRITFVTRSALWGFPDYTTAKAEATPDGSRLTVLARLRFGRSDFGINQARVRGWEQALQPLGR